MSRSNLVNTRAMLTNPLTCATCGEVIARGARMAWLRDQSPITEFWHTECGQPQKRKAKRVSRKAPRKLARKLAESTAVDSASTQVETTEGN